MPKALVDAGGPGVLSSSVQRKATQLFAKLR